MKRIVAAIGLLYLATLCLLLYFWPVGALVLGGLGAGALLCWGVFRLSISRNAAAIVTGIALALATLLVLLPGLTPATQFNIIMSLFILLFITFAGVIASLFTFLFLKSFEILDRHFLKSLLYFLPLTSAPVYLVATALRPRVSAHYPAMSGWLTWCCSIAIVVSCALLILTVARRVGQRIGGRHFVPLIAWKFLRSQREVYTPSTRRILSMRELTGSSSKSESGLPGLLILALLLGLLAIVYACLPSLFDTYTTISQVRLVILGLGAAILVTRSLLSRQWTSIPYGFVALAASLWVTWSFFTSMPEGTSIPTWAPAAVTGLVSAVIACQLVIRIILVLQRHLGMLSQVLDLRFAPPLKTRIREGVGASIFVSVVGVAIGVWALIVVLSVMSGFSGQMEERIVQTKDHIMVRLDSTDLSPETAPDLATAISELSGVASAGSYVEAEAMMSSSSNISSTITIRGFDPFGPAANSLAKTLIAGDIGLLGHPEDLVSFPGAGPVLLQNFGTPFGTPQPDWHLPFTEDTTSPETIVADDTLAGLLAMPPLPGQPQATTTDELRELPDAPGLLAMPGIDEEDKELPEPYSILSISESAEQDYGDNHVLPPIVIGQELARSMGAGIASRVTIISPDGDIGPMGVQPKARAFRVAAVFSTGMYEYDLKLAYMRMADAQRFFNLPTAADRIDVRLLNLSDAPAIRDSILALNTAGVDEILTWQEMNRNLFSALKLERVVMFIVLGFIVLIASFNIVTSLIIIIRRRLSAIAILKTMGAATQEVVLVFFLLGTAAGLFGMASGVIMGLSSCGIIENLGITLPREYYIRNLPVIVDGWQVTLVAIAALVVTALSSLYPGRLAARVLLVEGLKDER
jgi:ABC-type lipoprotein release transport system permease subunit